MNTQPAQLTDQSTVARGNFVLNPFGYAPGMAGEPVPFNRRPLMLILVWFSWRLRNAVQEKTGESHVNFEP